MRMILEFTQTFETTNLIAPIRDISYQQNGRLNQITLNDGILGASPSAEVFLSRLGINFYSETVL